MRAALSVLHAFQEDWDHIVNVAAVDDDEVFHEEAVGGVPPAVQHSWWEIQQILDLLVVDLGETGLHRIAALPFPYFLPKLLDCSRNYPLPLVGLVDLAGEDLLLSSHRVRLSWPCLSIGEHGGAIPVDGGFDELVDIALLIAWLLIIGGVEYNIELIAFLRSSEYQNVNFCEMLRVFSFYAFRQVWSARESYD
jgi:hypothetical protein